MTADREQVRRDAEQEIRTALRAYGDEPFAKDAEVSLDRLLVELEQAERERDAFATVDVERESARQQAEARLASVPALVEKGQTFLKAWIDASVSDEEGILATVDYGEFRAMWQAVDDAAQAFGAALTVYEQSQGGTK